MSRDVNTYDHLPEASQEVATALLGPPYVGYILQFILFGIATSNFINYVASRNYKSDSRYNRIYIWVVILLNTAAVGVNVFEAYYHGVSQNRTAKSVLMTSVPDALTPLLSGSVGAVVQSFLTLRSSKLFDRSPVGQALFVSIVGMMIVVGWVASVGAMIANLSLTFGFSIAPLNYNLTAGVWMWLSAAVDVSISTTLVVGMRRHLHGFNQSTDNAIRSIMKKAMLTASWTALFATCGALMSVVWPWTEVHTMDILFAFEVPLSSLYTLSLLTTLDSRKPIDRSRVVATPKINHLATPIASPYVHLPHTPNANPGASARDTPQASTPFNPYATAIAATRRPARPVPIMGFPMIDIDGAIERAWKFATTRPSTRAAAASPAPLGAGIIVRTLVEEHDDFDDGGGGRGGVEGYRRRMRAGAAKEAAAAGLQGAGGARPGPAAPQSPRSWAGRTTPSPLPFGAGPLCAETSDEDESGL